MTAGRIHSFESMGLVDGPGIRSVVFMQGCRIRCRYCHNPDTWDMCGSAESWTPMETVERLKRFKPYYGADGGVTFSGGEPLLQKEYLEETLALCRQQGINTCLDTAGVGDGDYEAVLRSTDLVLLDIKHYTDEGYRLITGHGMTDSLEFLRQAQELDIPLWLRHVVVPGLTDGDEHFQGLEEFISTIKNVKRVELLPYHVLGVPKYQKMGLPYSLEGVSPKNAEELVGWQARLNSKLR